MVRTRDRYPGDDPDELLETDPDETDTTYAVTRNANGQVTQESWTDTTTAFELKRITYTFNSELRVTTEVRQVFDPADGVTELSKKTITYSYSATNNVITGAVMVRDI